MNLIKFEIKKLLRSSYSFLMILILLLSISGYFVYNYINTIRMEELIEGEESLMFNNLSAIDELENQLKEDPSLEDSPSFIQELESKKDWLEKEQTNIQALKEEDWNYLLNQELKSYVDEVEMISDEYYPYRNMIKWPTDFTTQVHYYRTKWLYDNDIQPILRYGSLGEKTIYDQSYDDPIIEEIIARESNKYSSKGFYFLYKFLDLAFGMIGIGFFIFLFADILTKEGLSQYGPIHFLYSQPLSRTAILFNKYLALLIISILIMLVVSLFSILLGSLFDELGSWNYPILIYQAEESFYFMPLLKFVGISSLLFFMNLLFSYSLLFFFSLLTKRTVTAIGFTFGILLLGFVFTGESTSNLAPYNPIQYINVYDIVSMESAASQDNFDITWQKGLVTLLLSSILILLGSKGLSKIR